MVEKQQYQLFSLATRDGRELTEQEVRLTFRQIHGRAPDRAWRTGGGWLAGPLTQPAEAEAAHE